MPPGVKPGQRHDGQFQAGYDPRRNYGPKNSGHYREYRDAAREYSTEALNFLLQLVQDSDEETKERRLAAQFIIEQGYGKAVDTVQVAALTQRIGAGSEPLSLADLHQRLAPLLEVATLPDEDEHAMPAEDAEFIEVEGDE